MFTGLALSIEMVVTFYIKSMFWLIFYQKIGGVELLNKVFLLGKATNIELQENNKEESTITLSVPRSFKNNDGVYDTDFIECTLKGQIAVNTKQYCSTGNILGIKAHIEASTSKEEKVPMKLVADKITFLSSKKEDTE